MNIARYPLAVSVYNSRIPSWVGLRSNSIDIVGIIIPDALLCRRIIIKSLAHGICGTALIASLQVGHILIIGCSRKATGCKIDSRAAKVVVPVMSIASGSINTGIACGYNTRGDGSGT